MSPASDRLREARVAAGYSSARKAALAIGVPVATYAQHERGVRRMYSETQDAYHAFFATTPAAPRLKAARRQSGGC